MFTNLVITERSLSKSLFQLKMEEVLKPFILHKSQLLSLQEVYLDNLAKGLQVHTSADSKVSANSLVGL